MRSCQFATLTWFFKIRFVLCCRNHHVLVLWLSSKAKEHFSSIFSSKVPASPLYKPHPQRSATSGIPWGLQISLHIRSHAFSEMGGWGGFRSKLWLSRIWSFSWGGGYSGVNFGHLKSEVFILGEGGGGLSGLKFQKGAFSRIWTKIYCLRSTVQKSACASQIVSHMWRLIKNECAICLFSSNQQIQNVITACFRLDKQNLPEFWEKSTKIK